MRTGNLVPPSVHVQTQPRRRLSSKDMVCDEPAPAQRDSRDQRETYESNPEWRTHDSRPEHRRYSREW